MGYSEHLAGLDYEMKEFDKDAIHRLYAALPPSLGQGFTSLHLVGTNGKGSTGRLIAEALIAARRRVLHFSSPHIFDFKERYFLGNCEVLGGVALAKSKVDSISGVESKMDSIKSIESKADSTKGAQSKADSISGVERETDSIKSVESKADSTKGIESKMDLTLAPTMRLISTLELDMAHELLLQTQAIKEASYFEYATLLILAIAKLHKIEYAVIEAGLGGELDATSIFTHTLSIFTPIGLDHTERLGRSIEEIATTKLSVMGKRALLAPQDTRVLEIAKDIAQKKGSALYMVDSQGAQARAGQSRLGQGKVEQNKSKLGKVDEGKIVQSKAGKASKASYLEENLALASHALGLLGLDASYLEGYDFSRFTLKGRAMMISKDIMVDVGHNALAAKALAALLRGRQGSDDRAITLIFNCYKDKDVGKILGQFKGVVARIEVLRYSHQRLIDEKEIFSVARQLGIECGYFCGIKEGEFYLVFGSFSLIGAFLTSYEEG